MGIIYKLKCGDYYYIGKTINTFKQRFINHKSDCFNKRNISYNNKKYQKFRELGVNKENWFENIIYTIIYECNDNLLYCYENLVINLNNPYNLNTLKYKIDKIEEVEVNRWGTRTEEDIKQYNKKYYKNNQEFYKKYQVKYRKNNKNILQEKRDNNKDIFNEYIKKYRKNNKDKIKEYEKNRIEKQKIYKKKNKERLDKRRKGKILCDICNYEISRGQKSKHKKTKKHILNMDKNYLLILYNV